MRVILDTNVLISAIVFGGKPRIILEHFKKIKEADAVLALNFTKNNIKNYIGGNSLIEFGIAFDRGKKIFILNPLPKIDDLSYVTEIKSMEPIILKGDLGKIKNSNIWGEVRY